MLSDSLFPIPFFHFTFHFEVWCTLDLLLRRFLKTQRSISTITHTYFNAQYNAKNYHCFIWKKKTLMIQNLNERLKSKCFSLFETR